MNSNCTTSNATISHNIDKGGIEIRFPNKPEQSVIDSLKHSGFRWSRFSKCWWAKISHRSLTNAEQFGQLPHTITQASSHETNNDAAYVNAQEEAFFDNAFVKVN